MTYRVVRRLVAVAAGLVLAGSLAACQASGTSASGSSPLSPTPDPTRAGSPTPSLESPTPGPSASPTVQPSARPSAEPSVSPSAEPSAEPSPSADPTPTADPSPSPPPEPEVLRVGSTGPGVEQLQRLLASMRFFVPDIDGVFGDDTMHAVMAFQKANGIGIDGVVGPETRTALEHPLTLTPQDSSPGKHVEVDLSRQILMFVWKGQVTHVFDTSTGSGAMFENQSGDLVEARTPVGHFAVQRKIDGLRVSYLGELWRPAYFDGGYAIHGSPSVPAYPASHGCVRLTFSAMDWAFDRLDVGTPVFVY